MRRAGPLLRSFTALLVLAAAPLLASADPTRASDAAAFEPIGLPVECRIPDECYVQHYVDREPGPASADFRCGTLTYDGHRGTDFRLRDLDLMDRGVAVLAASDGRVERVRDGVRDAHMKLFGKEIAWHQGAGNMVQIDHGNGWKAIYGHMRRGSVTVRPGERVVRGKVLGLVGMSGLTEFPHLHFELAHRGQLVDPFVGITGAAGCRVDAHPLWSQQALASLAYRRSMVIAAGFSEIPLSREALLYEHSVVETLSPTAANIVFNVEFAGGRQGDLYHLRILSPDGSAFVEKHDRLTKDSPVGFRYIGRRLADKPGWPAGLYRGEFSLYREEGGVRRVFAERIETIKVE